MTPEAIVARAMLDAFKRKVGIARKLEFLDYLVAVDNSVAFIELPSEHGKLSTLAKYGKKPIFVSFGADYARTIISNMTLDNWASFCEVNQWQSKTAL